MVRTHTAIAIACSDVEERRFSAASRMQDGSGLQPAAIDPGREPLMKKKDDPQIATSDQTWVLSSLEHDQLVKAKKHPIPRRHLKGPELLVLWALRLYLLFMMTVVVYQVWTAAH